MAYATAADLIARYDRNDVAALVSDTEFPEELANLPGNLALQAALDDASGIIDAELLRGGRYQPVDLATLTGNSQKLLLRITCALAMQQLMERRPDRDPDRLERQEELARFYLKRLSNGEAVFDLPAQIAAGNSEIASPKQPDFSNLNLWRERAGHHYFPRRQIPNTPAG